MIKMENKTFINDEKAVAPVRGVIIMVAIMVALMSVTATYLGSFNKLIFLLLLVFIFILGYISGIRETLEIGWRNREPLSIFNLGRRGVGYWGSPETRFNIWLISSIILIIPLIGLQILMKNIYVSLFAPILGTELLDIIFRTTIITLFLMAGNYMGSD